MKSCPVCAREVADDVLVCPADGTALPEAASAIDPLVGQVIRDRYRVIRCLGQGRVGTVYLAEQVRIRRTVALKVLREDSARIESVLERFRHEARAMARLDSRYVTLVHDLDQTDDGRLFIVMEYHEGRTLRDVLTAEGPLPAARAVGLAVQIAEALRLAHSAGVLHRDVNPRAIMVLAHDGVKLMDFGVARLGDATAAEDTRGRSLAAAPSYAAPERLRGGPATERGDLYSLGIVLREMLTGDPPTAGTASATEAESGDRGRFDVSPGPLADLLAEMLAPEPEHRPRDMAEVVERLRALVSGLDSSGDVTLVARRPRTLQPASPGVGGSPTGEASASSPAESATGSPGSEGRTDPTREDGAPRSRTGPAGRARPRIGRAAGLLVLLLGLGGAFALLRGWHAAEPPIAQDGRPQRAERDSPVASAPREPAAASRDAVPGGQPSAAPSSAEPGQTSGAGADARATVPEPPSSTAGSAPLPPAVPPGDRDGGTDASAALSGSPDKPSDTVEAPARPVRPVAPQAKAGAPTRDSSANAGGLPPALDVAQIRTAVRERLRGRGLLRGETTTAAGLAVEVGPDGMVTLTGVVNTREDRDRAMALARDVPGVSGVKMRVNVRESWQGGS